MATAKKDEAKEPEIKGQGRSASYPWIDLKTAEERTQQFWDKEKTYEAPLSSAYKHWGYGEKSSGARLTVAAMLSYGLMSDKGSNLARMVKLTPLGVELIMAPTPEAKVKARKIAAIKPRVFGELLKTMDPENLPSDQTIAHYLVTQKNFNPSGAETFIKTFKGTIKHAQLKKSDIMSNIESLGAPLSDKAVAVGARIQWESGGVVQFAQPRPVSRVSEDGKYVFVEGNDAGIPVGDVRIVETRPHTITPSTGAMALSGGTPQVAQKSFKQDTYTLGDEGQVILQWPEQMTQESYDELGEWLDLQMRKIARLNKLNLEPKKKS